MSLFPHKNRKSRDQAEDAELLKLVGAVLDSTREKQKQKRLGLSGMLQRMKGDLRKAARKHPFAAIAVPIVFLFLVFLVGVATTSLARQREGLGDGAADSGGRRSGSSAGGRSPSSSAGSLETAGGTPGGGQAVNRDMMRQDIARELIARVVDGDYAQRSDIATGRFLRDFENQWFLLVDVDRERLQPARRGEDWLQVRGPYTTSEARLKAGLTGGVELFKKASEALIRVEQVDDVWKLEFIRVY